MLARSYIFGQYSCSLIIQHLVCQDLIHIKDYRYASQQPIYKQNITQAVSGASGYHDLTFYVYIPVCQELISTDPQRALPTASL